MKTLLLTLIFIFSFPLLAAHLEPVNVYHFEFINWSLTTKIVPLRNGGYIVQKYGRFITLFDSKGNKLKEIEAGIMSPLYQTGHQLKDGRILFINDQSLATIYDENLNLLEEYTLPAQYVWVPCETDNGKMIFPTYRDEEVLIKNGKDYKHFGGIGERMTEVTCLPNNRFTLKSKEGLVSIVDVNEEEPKILWQKSYNAYENSFKVVNEKIHLMNGEGLVTINPQTFEEAFYPNLELKEFSGVDYFHNSNYVTIEAVRNDEGKYFSEVILYSREGKKLATTIQKGTGASAEMPITVYKDQYIITDHCSEHIVLYDQNLNELSRMEPKLWLCSEATVLKDGFVFHGWDDDGHHVHQYNLVD